MDTSRLIPILGDNDPLFEISDYTKTMFEVLGGAPNTGGVSSPWKILALKSPWTNYGSGYTPYMGYRQEAANVHITGMVGGGATGSTIATLPTGFFPKSNSQLLAVASGGTAVIYVTSSGEIKYLSGPASPPWVCIDLIVSLT